MPNIYERDSEASFNKSVWPAAGSAAFEALQIGRQPALLSGIIIA